MINGKSILAIIPARAGSKRLPKKNILSLQNKPLIAWSIEAAKECTYIDTIVVTSDDNSVLTLAHDYGVEPLPRPEELASDTASTFSVVQHTIENIKAHDYILLLQPTSPLRRSKHIKESIDLLVQKKADAIVSVTQTQHSPLWANTLPKDNSMTHFISDKIKNIRSQDLPDYFQLNGAIYLCNTEKLLKEESFLLKNNIYAYKMDRASSIDIDETIDFDLAHLYMEQAHEPQ